jgi:hypothetical protein
VALGLLGGIGYIVGQQFTSLANRLPDYQENIETKLSGLFKPGQQSTTDRLKDRADRVTAKIEKPRPDESSEEAPIQKVQVVTQPQFQERLRSSMGPTWNSWGSAASCSSWCNSCSWAASSLATGLSGSSATARLA